MRRKFTYHLLCLMALLWAIEGCNRTKIKKLNRHVTLWRKDKIPYGTFYAFENLPRLFPNASISVNALSPGRPGRWGGFDEPFKAGQRKAYLIISPQVHPDPTEINALMNYVGNGNIAFISSFFVGDSLLNLLKLKISYDNEDLFGRDSIRLRINSPFNNDTLAFGYPGDHYASYVSSMDTQYTTVLGTDRLGRPDFVKFNYKGGGAIYLHFDPMAFTNFFLLHKENKSYYETAFSYLPNTVTDIKWDDYFRYSKQNSVLNYLLSIPSFQWAFWLLLVFFLILYVIESKRRQRMIPALASLRNSSLDFVQTVGRLYFQRRDNLNLAHKMSSHFLGMLRTKYHLTTTYLNDELADKVSYKSGYDLALAHELIDSLRNIQMVEALSDKGLMKLNNQIEAFYKLT